MTTQPGRRVLRPGSGSLGSVDRAGCWPAPRERSRPRPRSVPRCRTVAGSGRRAACASLAYNTDPLTERRPPGVDPSIFTEPDVEGPGSASRRRTRPSRRSCPRCGSRSATTRPATWLEGIEANDAETYEKNSPILEAVASPARSTSASSTTTTCPSSRRTSRTSRSRTTTSLADDPGRLVIVAGAAVLANARQPTTPQRFVEFLLSDDAPALLRRRGGGDRVSPRRGDRPPWEGLAAARRDRRA